MSAPVVAPPTVRFNADAVRAEFPILAGTSRGKPLAYLDSAATSQKPLAVLDTMRDFYGRRNANIHRGVYQLSEEATLAWDRARERVARFVGGDAGEIVFVRGTTEAINLVARSFVGASLRPGDVVLVTEMEHHSNIVPWQLAGARTVPVPITGQGDLDLEAAERLLAHGARLLAVTHVSNALGTINPIAELCATAHRHGVPVLVDGAQGAVHEAVDVRAMGCDFYCFSSHKVFGPGGIGVLWARRELLEAMPPWQGGGDMIDEVAFERTTFAEVPRRFEAGTPNIGGVIGLAAALDWFEALDRSGVHRHEASLLAEASAALQAIPGVTIVGRPARRASILSFTVEGVHPHDVASILDSEGVCIRAGHHCTQPLHRRLGLTATARASIALYNNEGDIEALARGVTKARRMFA